MNVASLGEDKGSKSLADWQRDASMQSQRCRQARMELMAA